MSSTHVHIVIMSLIVLFVCPFCTQHKVFSHRTDSPIMLSNLKQVEHINKLLCLFTCWYKAFLFFNYSYNVRSVASTNLAMFNWQGCQNRFGNDFRLWFSMVLNNWLCNNQLNWDSSSFTSYSIVMRALPLKSIV